MSEFIFRCPWCGTDVTANESDRGSNATCPVCSAEIEIPRGLSCSQSAPLAISPQSTTAESFPVTSGDIPNRYEIVGMVCFSVGTRGGMLDYFITQKNIAQPLLDKLKNKDQVSKGHNVSQVIVGLGVNTAGHIGLSAKGSGASFRSDDLELAFFIAVREIRRRAIRLGADAVIGFRYDIDFDSNSNVLNFVATAYGTAVRVRHTNNES